MDFKSKGMNWVVNLRQKFETVCTEMEDKLCQEAKYVENQVQTVGVNVNKFFAEVMQDFLPSSCRASIQENVSGSYVEKNADAINADHINMETSHKESSEIASSGNDSCRSSNSSEDSDFHGVNGFLPPSYVNPVGGASLVRSLEENNVLKLSKPTIAEDNSVKNEKHAPPLSQGVALVRNQASLSSSPRSTVHLIPDASLDPAKGVGSSLSMKEDNDILIHKQSSVDQEKITSNMEPSKPTIEEDNSVKNEKHAPLLSQGVALVRNQASLSSSPQSSFHLDPDTSSDPAKGVGSSLSMKEDNDILIHKQSGVDQEKYTSNVEPSPPELSVVLSALKNLSASSFFSEFSDSDTEKACVVPLIKLPSGASVETTRHESTPQAELIRNNAVDAFESSSDVSSSLSSYDLNPLVIPSEDLESGPSSSCGILPTESKVITESSDVNAVESCMENIEQFDNVNLGDSCVVVDNKDLLLSLRAGPRRSFKKTLQQALASRMRSTKQREYEQLAILYGDIDTDIRERSTSYFPVKDLQLKKLSTDDVSSDWELV